MEGLACITGFVYWARLTPKFWKPFPVYLLIITCCEFAGWYMNNHAMYRPAKWMYSYFVVPLEFLFMFYLYCYILPKGFRKTVLVLTVIFLISFLFEFVLLLKINWLWMSLTYITGSVIILTLSVIYLLQLISNARVTAYKNEPFFWVNLGLLLFYVGTFPYYATANYLYSVNQDLFWVLSWMMVILNYIMYSFFIAGFLCFRKLQKY